MKLIVIHGPNLNMLGSREPHIYGTLNLENINSIIMEYAKKTNITVDTIQTNHEGDIIEAVHNAEKKYDGIIINPAGYGHTSVAILDAFKAIKVPAVEVHLSNIYAREEFRRHTVTGNAMVGVISGFGAYSYILGLDALINHISSKKDKA